MTERQFTYLLKYATRLGIKTFEDLAAYKKAKNVTNNGELIATMFQDLKERNLAA